MTGQVLMLDDRGRLAGAGPSSARVCGECRTYRNGVAVVWARNGVVEACLLGRRLDLSGVQGLRRSRDTLTTSTCDLCLRSGETVSLQVKHSWGVVAARLFGSMQDEFAQEEQDLLLRGSSMGRVRSSV